MKIKVTLQEDLLGTACNNPEVHREFIASKSKDADKMEQEIAALASDELIERSMTVFPRNKDGKPIIWDYQVKGFLKEATGVLIELMDKELKVGKTKLSKYTFKRVVDNYLFVFPRQAELRGTLGEPLTRPLRADTMKGERISLATSEVMKAGTVFEVEVRCLAPVLESLVKECLEYGSLKGLGQWRNAGWGRFTWEEVK